MFIRALLKAMLATTALTYAFSDAFAQTANMSTPTTSHDRKTNPVAPKQGPTSEKITVLGRSPIAAAMVNKIPLKSQYAASHISKAEIDKASPVSTIDSLLNTEPSIHATEAGPLGVQNNITFRAFNSAELSQTIDGISLNDPLNGGATNQAEEYNDVLLIPLDVNSIDLYRGINNPANNSYNSLAGTINYDTVMPSTTRSASITGTAGSFGTLGYTATANTGKSYGAADVVSFSQNSSEGWLKYNKDRNQNIYNAITVDTGSSGKIYDVFLYNHNTGEEAYDEPSALIGKYGYDYQSPPSEYNQPLNDTHFLNIVGTTQKLGDLLTVDVKGFFGTDDFTRNAFSNPADQKTGYYVYNSDIEGNSTTFYGEYEQQIGLQPSLTLRLPYNTIKIGGNYTLAHLHSREYFGDTDPVVQVPGVNDVWDEHDTRTEYSLYIQDEIDLLNDKLKITPGVKYLFENSKVNEDAGSYDYPSGGTPSDTAHFTAPTLGVSYEFLPNTVLYGAIGENIEFPTINGLYDNIDGKNAAGEYTNDVEPVHIQPEHVTDYEVGLRYANRPYGFSAALGFYLERFTNTFITQVDPTTQLETTTNGGSSDYKGIEFQLAEDFGEKHLYGQDVGDYTLYLNYAFNDAYYTSSFELASAGNNNSSVTSVSKGQPVALVPQNTLSLGGAWNYHGWQATADANYVTSQYINQLNAGTTSDLREPAYFTLNLGISKTIHLDTDYVKSMKIAFFADNVLNRHYDAFAYAENYTKYSPLNGQAYAAIDEAAPRAFYGSVTLNF